MPKSKRKGRKRIITTLDLWRRVNREIALETPHIRGGPHQTHKKDRIRNNKIHLHNLEEL